MIFSFHRTGNVTAGRVNCSFAFRILYAIVGCGILQVQYGMGRGAGNCHMESLLSLLRNPKYRISPILDFIAAEMPKLKESGAKWGFDIPYMLTGALNIHPSSAIKFIKDGRDDYSEFYKELLEDN